MVGVILHPLYYLMPNLTVLSNVSIQDAGDECARIRFYLLQYLKRLCTTPRIGSKSVTKQAQFIIEINIGSRSGYERVKRSGSEPHAKFRAALSHGRIKSGELMTRQEFARKDSAQEGGIFGFGFFIGAPRERGGRVQAGAMTGHFCGAGRKSARFSSL